MKHSIPRTKRPPISDAAFYGGRLDTLTELCADTTTAALIVASNRKAYSYAPPLEDLQRLIAAARKVHDAISAARFPELEAAR
jgi:hypothetical protein